jgi:hypothetical protein
MIFPLLLLLLRWRRRRRGLQRRIATVSVLRLEVLLPLLNQEFCGPDPVPVRCNRGPADATMCLFRMGPDENCPQCFFPVIVIKKNSCVSEIQQLQLQTVCLALPVSSENDVWLRVFHHDLRVGGLPNTHNRTFCKPISAFDSIEGFRYAVPVANKSGS